MSKPPSPDIFGVVVIGRNEGDRLRLCLETCQSHLSRVVYVDSGSIDDSLKIAGNLGVTVISLYDTLPFSAARARNTGYAFLKNAFPDMHCIQFVDGDCEIDGNWIRYATECLAQSTGTAIVAGRLREKFPEFSIYNRLGEIEWNSSGAGDVESVGGIFMIRCSAFDDVGGFDDTVTAGEEPELCLRLLRRGWRIRRMDCDMATHDLSMLRFCQWWQRMIRSGYGGLDVGSRFGIPMFVKSNYRTMVWTIWILMVVAFGILTALTGSEILGSITAFLALIWPAQLARITFRMLKKKYSFGISVAYAFFMAIAFMPQALGQLQYLGDRLRNRSARLIEYKGKQLP